MDVGFALSGQPTKTVPFIEAIKEITSLDKINLHASALKEINKYQIFIDRLIKSSQNITNESSILICLLITFTMFFTIVYSFCPFLNLINSNLSGVYMRFA
jgi:hypothetical protein